MNHTTPTPSTILEGIPRAGYDVHMCPFPGSLFACLTYLGDPCDYDTIMGVSGAAFRRFWNRDDGGNIDLSYLGDEPFRRAFQAVGYEYRTIPAEKDAMIRAIKESIARGVPPISFGIIGPPEAGIIAGYQGECDVLFGWSYFQEGRERYYEKADWFETMEKGAGKGLIIIGAKTPERLSERELLVPSLEWAIDLERTPKRACFPNHICGLAAYDGWADGLEVDADYPTDNDPDHGDALDGVRRSGLMVWERQTAARYLRRMAAIAPQAAGHLNAAAECYEKVGNLSEPLWPWGHTMPGGAKKALVDATVRRTMAAHVRSAKAAETQAVEHLEQALAALR